MSNTTIGFYCHTCGKYHEGLPLDYGYDLPNPVLGIAEAERNKRVVTSDDLCMVDGKEFYVRGVIEIPVVDTGQTFAWGVWASLSEKNFKRTIELMDTPGRESEPPYFGWLCNALPYPQSTVLLKTHVHTRPVGLRPRIELEPTNHPLAVEQRTGITTKRVQEIAEIVLHGKDYTSSHQ